MKISILGTAGIPASYGGFETLAENLARYHQANNLPDRLIVYCSAKGKADSLPENCFGAELRYIRLDANGVSSIVYDVVSMFYAARQWCDVILLLGVSGAVALPFMRLLSKARIVTNIDGIEWKREKWKGLAKWFLRFSEFLAVKFSHEVIADNAGIAKYVVTSYGRNCHVIAYGGDHAIVASPKPYEGVSLPSHYALALCRIEPENNIAMILESFARKVDLPLVFIGNWNGSIFGKELQQRYSRIAHLYLLDPIYDLGVLHSIRHNAAVYIHGHSAGGTNPSLVEMMHFGIPILAYDCVFNRSTTGEQALYFANIDDLAEEIASLDTNVAARVGQAMEKLAREKYTWDQIGAAYFKLLLRTNRMARC